MEEILSELRYRAYRAQRDAHPEKEPGRWARIFGPSAAQFEARYQEERARELEEAIAAAQWLEFGPPYDDEWYESAHGVEEG